ncbi:hypothetical protein Poli38472_002121 [Pythium oligandrum]|uniref:Lebercilin domain-containing protein n=1 Tax=Pythium oligandrum TaxID=41045 RepID=A0A8K1FGU9_PYTOL|nr:hypothetical protein Poli38472_002121 [Pythium oligandrum]|eukprot:TMW63180.1 hypothetical protein Poli38472_002121 [Pythium oligandrum]
MEADDGEYELEYEAESPAKNDAQSALEASEEDTEAKEPSQPETIDTNTTAADGNDGVDDEERVERLDEPTAVEGGDLTARKSPPKGRKRRLVVKESDAVAALTRKLKQFQKMNADLHHQLHKFYQNEAVAFLENKSQEKQRQIDSLQQENRALANQQRALTKQVEELQESAEKYPQKRQAMRDELRACREQLRQFKEKHQTTEERSNRAHQQIVDLTVKNKTLTERIRQLESSLTASTRALSAHSVLGGQDAEAIIASQEDEITRLQHRVDVMKKSIRHDRTKHEKELQASQDELEQTRSTLQDFHRQLFEKEKTIRSQYLQIKHLKRSLKDVMSGVGTNQHLQQYMIERGVRHSRPLGPSSSLQSQAGLSARSVSQLPDNMKNFSKVHEVLSRLKLLPLDTDTAESRSIDPVQENASLKMGEPNHSVQPPTFIPCPPTLITGERKASSSHRSSRLVAHTSKAVDPEEQMVPWDSEEPTYPNSRGSTSTRCR